jgi:hypothetical protein
MDMLERLTEQARALEAVEAGAQAAVMDQALDRMNSK